MTIGQRGLCAAAAGLALAALVGSPSSAANVTRAAYAGVRAPSFTVRVVPRRSGHFTEYAIPTPYENPEEITVGPDGALWFTEFAGKNIGRITTSGVLTEFVQPPQAQGWYPGGIAAGPDGALWFAGGDSGPSGPGAIGRITTSGQFTYYPVTGLYPHGITAAPDGNMWFTADYYVGKITMAGRVKIYQEKGLNRIFGDIAAAPSGALYFSATHDSAPLSYLGVMNTPGRYSYARLPGGRSVACVAVDPRTSDVWFTKSGRYVGRLDTAGHVVEYRLRGGKPPLPIGITLGPDGEMWFAEWFGNAIARISSAGAVTEYEVPTRKASPNRIVTGPDGALWFTETLANKIGRYQP